jgi:cytoskeletal protein CcmA (bactofilin family)
MNILSEDVEIKGSIRFVHQLAIQGKVDGDVVTQGDLLIGESARIKGTVTAANVTVSGKVDGNVTATGRCRVEASATVFGDITAGSVAIDAGATFQGRSRIGKANAAPAPKPAGAKP